MNVLDLFSGIGGFSLGLERAGMRTVAFCEIDPYCRAVLRKHWPDVPVFGDVRTVTVYQGWLVSNSYERCQPSDQELQSGRSCIGTNSIDVICGGFPCQDISVAGKGAGIYGARSGLWKEYARIIGEVRPRYVIVENVAALLGRGLGTVLGDLAEIGYSSRWDCISASAVGAPHRRDRIWIIAWRNDFGSCQVIRRDAQLQSLWQAVSAAAGCGESESWSLLFDRMQQRGPLFADDGGYCSAQKHVLRAGHDVEGDCSKIWSRMETHPPKAGSGRGAVEERPTPGCGSSFNGQVSANSASDEGTSRSSPELHRDGRQTGKPCRCIEAQAFATAQAIGANIGQIIHGGPGLFRPPEWLYDYAAVVGVNVNGDESIPASAVGAPHRHDRVWIIAAQTGAHVDDAQSMRCGFWHTDDKRSSPGTQHPLGNPSEDVAYTDGPRLEGRIGAELRQCAGERAAWQNGAYVADAAQQYVHWSGNAGTGRRRESSDGRWWLVEPSVGRVAHGVPSRVDRLRALGNAVVPQIPEIIGRAIMAHETARHRPEYPQVAPGADDPAHRI